MNTIHRVINIQSQVRVMGKNWAPAIPVQSTFPRLIPLVPISHTTTPQSQGLDLPGYQLLTYNNSVSGRRDPGDDVFSNYLGTRILGGGMGSTADGGRSGSGKTPRPTTQFFHNIQSSLVLNPETALQKNFQNIYDNSPNC